MKSNADRSHLISEMKSLNRFPFEIERTQCCFSGSCCSPSVGKDISSKGSSLTTVTKRKRMHSLAPNHLSYEVLFVVSLFSKFGLRGNEVVLNFQSSYWTG